MLVGHVTGWLVYIGAHGPRAPIRMRIVEAEDVLRVRRMQHGAHETHPEQALDAIIRWGQIRADDAGGSPPRHVV